MNKIRKVAHGTAWFENNSRIFELMKYQCSATRSAYQVIHKHKLKNNDVKIYVKKNYMNNLNQRYVADSCSLAKGIIHESSIFGGKKLWDKLIKKNITKEQWRQIRNNQLYSRGDKTKKGNPNIRIQDDKILINDPKERGKWIEGKFWMPNKFEIDLNCYDVRLIYKNNKFEVKISWEEEAPELIQHESGMIGIDCNPDGVALAETNEHGNLIKHFYIKKDRIQYARKEKRNYDIYQIAKQVVDYALKTKKRIALERLSFRKKKSYKKFNRMSHNFVYRKLLQAIKSRAAKYSIEVKEINPAFTSVLGLLKYKKMYSLNRHTAAALVISRRALDIKERKDFKVKLHKKKKDILNLEGRGISIALTQKAWSWLQDKFLKPNITILTESELAAGLKSAISSSAGEIPASEPIDITGLYGELKNISNFLGDERTSLKS